MEAEIRADLGLWQCFPCSRRLRTDAATGSATGLGIERRLHSGDAEVLASVTIHNTNAIAARPQTEAMS